MKIFKFIADPGHAWLQVDLLDIESTTVTFFEFSPYSFFQGTTVWLEEDVDAGLFLLAYETAHGRNSFRIEHVHVPDFNRNLPRMPGNRYDFERTMKRCAEMEAALRASA